MKKEGGKLLLHQIIFKLAEVSINSLIQVGLCYQEHEF